MAIDCFVCSPVAWLTTLRDQQESIPILQKAVIMYPIDSYQALMESHNLLEKQKDQAYRERDILLAFLCRIVDKVVNTDLLRVYRNKHPDNDITWEQDWKNIIVIEYLLPSYDIEHGTQDYIPVQMAWHVHDSEMVMFQDLPEKPNNYDGHTTKQKYNRILDVVGVLLPYQLDLTKDFPD